MKLDPTSGKHWSHLMHLHFIATSFRRIVKPAIVVSVLAILASATAAESAGTPIVFNVRNLHASPNPTGLQIGFWANYSQQQGVLKDFGKRPIGRVDFTSWKHFEQSKGSYAWDNEFQNIKRSHRYGETVIACVNVSFSPEITRNKNTFPDGYHPRITDPATRAAAKRFLADYTRELLHQAGSVYLSIDYEIIFNYHLYTAADLPLAEEWRDWYVEAAATVREAAHQAGDDAVLRLIPIVNGNNFKEDALLRTGASGNRWLVDVVQASDALGIDTYYMKPGTSVTNALGTIENIQLTANAFADGKEVIVCENGFSSGAEKNPHWHMKKGKYGGTEAGQKAYYEQLFATLAKANQPKGAFQNRLRGFNLWCYRDNHEKQHTDANDAFEIYFGMIRNDGSPKPAYEAVRQGIDRLERDPFHRPFLIQTNANADSLAALAGQEFLYSSGTEYDYLEFTCIPGAEPDKTVFEITVARPGAVLVCVNGRWLADAEKSKTDFSFKLGQVIKPGASNNIAVCFTGDVFPFRQRLTRIALK